MIDPFDVAREAWLTAIGARPVGRTIDPAPPVEIVSRLKRLRLELATMALLEPTAPAAAGATLIVAPFALHDASLADFAPGHSVAAALAEAGVGGLALTFWKSASAAMKHFCIDDYLADLNVAVDDLGGHAALIGLCQGGWLAAAYAARFPRKVSALVLAGAPIDLEATPSAITRLVASLPPMAFESLVALGGGRVFGRLAEPQWTAGLRDEFLAEDALQEAPGPALSARFADWDARTVDLPGPYFLQTTEWLFRENRLARGRFPALGRLCRLDDIAAPVYALAGAEDEVAPALQVLAAKSLCRGARVTARAVPGKHLALFMGRRNLAGVWREIAAWLARVTPATGRLHSKARRAG